MTQAGYLIQHIKAGSWRAQIGESSLMDFQSTNAGQTALREDHTGQPVPIMGFDMGGEVFELDNRILRGIYPEKGALYHNVLQTCEKNDLFAAGIILTRKLNECLDLDLPYELVLEHARVPFVSYPHEWPASMLKAAAELHVRLFVELGVHGLTIKDWHPYNILFEATRPIFVDFCSIIPLAELPKEEYLTPPQVPVRFRRFWDTTSRYVWEMYRRMYIPYFLSPLLGMANQEHGKVRSRLFATTMNVANDYMSPMEVLSQRRLHRWRFAWWERVKRIALIDPSPTKRLFFHLLTREIKNLTVAPAPSGYLDYYAAKGERFAFEPSEVWTRKQLVIYNVIRDERPSTLLDIGSNTGWFSILAARMGCQVVALDIDESCANELYTKAEADELPILPLVMDISNPTPSLWPAKHMSNLPHWIVRTNTPVLLAAEQRFKCDMVLALAIVHHLTLGLGLSLDRVSQ
ncbi:MAG: class I SAM-dependent methyltransferase, partial [Caldilineaceae bacterium]|nr:class I SAM-dependent methyltransferase [Caldilineaceae bacterium]